jgi:hypothetical protein
MSYRDDVAALAARHAALSAEVQQKTRELDSASRLLDEAKAKAKLPVLPNIQIAAPCTADWNAMTGDEQVRACAQCNKNVYNLSSMTRDEAEALIVAKEGKLCVRYFQRKDGTILLKDCTIGVSKRRKRRVIAAGAAALLASGAGAAMMLRHKSDAPVMGAMVQPPVAIQGEIAIPDEQSPDLIEPPQQEQFHAKMGGISMPPPIENK